MQKYLFTEDRGILIDTALNYLLLFPEDTHTPNKCEAHCEQWEIGHLGGEMATRLQNSDNNSNNLCFKTVLKHAAMEYSVRTLITIPLLFIERTV